MTCSVIQLDQVATPPENRRIERFGSRPNFWSSEKMQITQPRSLQAHTSMQYSPWKVRPFGRDTPITGPRQTTKRSHDIQRVTATAQQQLQVSFGVPCSKGEQLSVLPSVPALTFVLDLADLSLRLPHSSEASASSYTRCARGWSQTHRGRIPNLQLAGCIRYLTRICQCCICMHPQ